MSLVYDTRIDGLPEVGRHSSEFPVVSHFFKGNVLEAHYMYDSDLYKFSEFSE